jgi:hypothetical protein
MQRDALALSVDTLTLLVNTLALLVDTLALSVNTLALSVDTLVLLVDALALQGIAKFNSLRINKMLYLRIALRFLYERELRVVTIRYV